MQFKENYYSIYNEEIIFTLFVAKLSRRQWTSEMIDDLIDIVVANKRLLDNFVFNSKYRSNELQYKELQELFSIRLV